MMDVEFIAESLYLNSLACSTKTGISHNSSIICLPIKAEFNDVPQAHIIIL